jgi:putative thiamine transport system permease protein
MPYAVLILAVAWRELDPAWGHAAGVLGAGYWKTLFRVRLPLLIKPVTQAAAVALAVSVAQYLPTLLLGAGRHQTLAIELVTSFGGVDRRVIATLAALQSILPLIAFIAALMLPHLFKPAKLVPEKRMSS